MTAVTVTPRNTEVTPQVLPGSAPSETVKNTSLSIKVTLFLNCLNTYAHARAHARAGELKACTSILGVTALQPVQHGKNRVTGGCYRVTARPARQNITISTREGALPRPQEVR